MAFSRPLPRLLVLALLLPLPALALPGFGEVKAGYVPSEARLLARDGQLLQTLRIDKSVRRQPWTALNEISPALVRAVIVSEDKRFLEHDGVDWQAAGKAAWSNFWGKRTRGASTLSMQLAGLIDEDGQRRGRRSFFEKISQTTVALRLENFWSKKQIIEAYLNLVSFRGELQGVGAMSRQLFGKWPHGLDEREAALAAALLRSPNAAPGLVSKRACNLLKEMDRAGECEGLEGFAAQALSGGLRAADNNGDEQIAPHLARKLLEQPGQQLRSSLDAELQRFAGSALRRHLAALSRQNAEDGAVLVIDNASGEILAWVGSSGDLSGAAEVDGVTALRQAGSTLKPFLYAQAFERRQLTPASLIEDAPLTLDTGNGLYAPQNYEPHYRGWVSARMALAGSLNVPAVKTLVRLGPELFQQRLKLAGFASLKQSGDWYGYSLALGSADISLLMLANAYRTLANEGKWSPLRVTPGSAPTPIPCQREGCAEVFSAKAHAAFTPASAFLVGDILADRSARAATFGLESWLATHYWSAAKTGTSKDMRDNWCAGFSRRYTVAVWVGNASGSPMHDVSGVSGAAPVWREVIDWLHRGDAQHGRPRLSSRPPAAPAGLVRSTIRFEPAREPARHEWFIAGTEQAVIRTAASKALAGIAYPANGSVIALDPDIPPSRQRVPLRLSAPTSAGWVWRIDGKTLGKATARTFWLPQPGRHQLSLENARGEIIDSVIFDVRALKARLR
ncbi:MAG: penicillin-binding protein 1C [Azonexus sp.]